MNSKKTDHFPLVYVQNAIIVSITAIAGSMDRISMIQKWKCIFCHEMKSASRLDWMRLPCDHLICLGCFWSQKPFLQSCHKCPFCGHQLPPLFTAFSWLVVYQQGAHDNEKSEHDINAIE